MRRGEIITPTIGDPYSNQCVKNIDVKMKLPLSNPISCDTRFVSLRRKEVEDRRNAWDDFVGSIRSKLTVKQVVDGVRSGGDLSFDYVLLVLTAE